MDRTKYLRQLHAQFGVAQPDVIGLVQRATGGTVAASRRLIRGDECEVHRVVLTDGSVVYLRVAFPGTPPGKILHEAWAMDRARGAGVPVPAVLATETIHTDAGERAAAVIAEAPGDQLLEVLPVLRPDGRMTVMNGIGRVLRLLHSIEMPGAGVPDDQGGWSDPDTQQRSYLTQRLADCAHLAAAGLTPNEVDRAIAILNRPIDDPGKPVLCHGDISPQHVFIDRELRIVGLIDWGMWHAGSAVSELAGLALANTSTDFSAILAGHGGVDTDPEFPDRMSWHAVAGATQQIAWLVTSGQTAELDRAAAALRDALTMERPDR